MIMAHDYSQVHWTLDNSNTDISVKASSYRRLQFGHISYIYFHHTVKILKFGTPQTIAIIVLKIEKFDVTLH